MPLALCSAFCPKRSEGIFTTCTVTSVCLRDQQSGLRLKFSEQKRLYSRWTVSLGSLKIVLPFVIVIIIIFTIAIITACENCRQSTFLFAAEILKPYKNAKCSVLNSPSGIRNLCKTVIDFCSSQKERLQLFKRDLLGVISYYAAGLMFPLWLIKTKKLHFCCLMT